MGADRDNVSPQELLENGEMAILLYKSALVERAQVISNEFMSFPPLRDFGDASLLGRAFPPPSETLWTSQLSDTVVVNGVVDLGEARLSAVQDLVGRALGKRLQQMNRFCDRLRKHIDNCRVAMERVETARDRWIASQDERSTILAEVEARFGPASELLPRMEFRFPELEATTRSFAQEWTSRHARWINEIHRGRLDAFWPVLGGASYATLPNPWNWTAEQLMAMHEHYAETVEDQRYSLEQCVRGLHREHLSHTQARLCACMAAAAREQQRLDAIAETSDDWEAAARHEVNVLQPLQLQYEHALKQMVAQDPMWQSHWHTQTYRHLTSATDAELQILEETHTPLTEEEVASGPTVEAESAARTRERMTRRLDALITEHGAELALADGLANRCTEALLVRRAWERNVNWPESKQVLDAAIDDMLAKDTWKDRNHRGAIGADEATERIYQWIDTAARSRALGPPNPRRAKCDNPNKDDWNRPLLPCPTTTTDANLSAQTPLPAISQAAAVAFGRRLFLR